MSSWRRIRGEVEIPSIVGDCTFYMYHNSYAPYISSICIELGLRLVHSPSQKYTSTRSESFASLTNPFPTSLRYPLQVHTLACTPRCHSTPQPSKPDSDVYHSFLPNSYTPDHKAHNTESSNVSKTKIPQLHQPFSFFHKSGKRM